MSEIVQSDIINWRATVRKAARNSRAIAEMINELDGQLGSKQDFEATAIQLERLGDWLDSLLGVTMGKAVNGHGRVSL